MLYVEMDHSLYLPHFSDHSHFLVLIIWEAEHLFLNNSKRKEAHYGSAWFHYCGGDLLCAEALCGIDQYMLNTLKNYDHKHT